MDNESGESTEPMEELEIGAWLTERSRELIPYGKERSVVRRKLYVDGRASVTKDEQRELRIFNAGHIDNKAAVDIRLRFEPVLPPRVSV